MSLIFNFLYINCINLKLKVEHLASNDKSEAKHDDFLSIKKLFLLKEKKSSNHEILNSPIIHLPSLFPNEQINEPSLVRNKMKNSRKSKI